MSAVGCEGTTTLILLICSVFLFRCKSSSSLCRYAEKLRQNWSFRFCSKGDNLISEDEMKAHRVN